MAQLVLGADSLCWHTRLEAGELTLGDVLEEGKSAGAEFIQLNLHHTRALGDAGLADVARRAEDLGLPLLASGDFVGSATKGATVEEGTARVARWIDQAAAIASPILRVASGFYRAELAGRPDLIAQEREHVTGVLQASVDRAEAAGVRVLLENHSDFSSAEYVQIVEALDHRVGVFLDVINPISSLEDPLPVVERLAPLAPAGHVKDYEFESHFVPDRYHRRGFQVHYRYPGEGVAALPALLAALDGRVRGEFHLSVEGLDNQAGVADQHERLSTSLRHLRGLIEQHQNEAGTP
jgi:sugar phosphate isomerase/epimerase